MSISSRLSHHLVLASAVAASVTAVSEGAVTRWTCNLVIPNTTAGLYLNLDTRTSATSSMTGWDLELASQTPSAGTLSAYGAIGAGFMRAPGTNGLYFGSLSSGTTVNTASAFTQGGMWDAAFESPSMKMPGAWKLNSGNAFGFKFLANDGLLHFAYAYMTVGASSAVRTLNYVEWETTANAGVTVAPAPGALAVAALAGVGRGRRRR
jgi:hypothetical protein